jgi:TatD DNase family protein
MKPIFINAHCHQMQHADDWSLLNISSVQDFNLGQTCSVGIHPWQIHEFTDEESILEMRKIMEKEDVKAIGECGLDKLCSSKWEGQLEVFRKHVVWAQELNKPVILHCVRSQQEILKELKGTEVKFVFHGFNRNLVMAIQVIQHGGYLSMNEIFLKTNTGREVARNVPKNRVFLETDDLSVSVIEAYICLAEIWCYSVEEVKTQLWLNANEIGLIKD